MPLHRATQYYPTLDSVLVYPPHYFSSATGRLPGGLVAEGVQGRLGQSWYRGLVVLSWDDFRRTAHDHSDGHNVVFMNLPAKPGQTICGNKKNR